MNERIQRLRGRFLNSERKVDIERAVIITETYRENEEKPQIIKRALALKAILSHMSITLRKDELIVGNQTRYCRGAPLFPEYAVDWILEQMDTFPTRQGDRFHITEAQKRRLRGVLPYWKDKCLRDRIKGWIPPFLKGMLRDGVFANENYTMSSPGHLVPNYEAILQRGLISIGDECKERMFALNPADLNYGDKFNLYHACSIVCDAVVEFAQRYSHEVDLMARKEKAEKRRRELFRISENCRRVPGEAARDLWEALQCIYFLQVAIQVEGNGLAIALGRLDQMLYPFYRQDRERGVLTRESALELIHCFYLKLNEVDKIYSNEATRYLQGPSHGQTITLGGVTEDGRDATNELSHMLVEADLDVRLVQPDIAIRVHPTLPEDFLRKVSINIREGLTKPKLFNDEVVIPSLLDLGVPMEDARGWAVLGCSEPVVSGKTNSGGNSGQLNLAKCLELALNNGKCRLSQKRMGPSTGNAAQFKTFEDVLAAFKSQVRYFIQHLVLYDNIIDKLHAEVTPLPLCSTLMRECLKKGLEFNAGGAQYNFTSPVGIGTITTGDSLAAIKTLVYKERSLSMEQLLEALEKNFEGREDIQQMLINRAPKFGNDDDLVDDLCNEVLKVYCDELRNYRNRRNGPFIGALYHLTANIPFGRRTAATPDGRKSGDPLNDGGISPVHGRDRKGPTAVAKSVGKLDNQRVPHGCILNQRFHPSLLEGEDKIKQFEHYVRTFMELGGWHIQFNVVTSDILREAQREPEKYRHLLIRVAGYSAYFTQLEEELQNDIIARTEHRLQ